VGTTTTADGVRRSRRLDLPKEDAETTAQKQRLLEHQRQLAIAKQHEMMERYVKSMAEGAAKSASNKTLDWRSVRSYKSARALPVELHIVIDVRTKRRGEAV
jgi:nucleosome binding factor SPN SPT16 subunit